MATKFSKIVAVFDFDQTLADTSTLTSLRDQRNWPECETRAASIPFTAGIEQVLSSLADEGATLAVASSAPSRYLRAFLRRLNVSLADVMHFYSTPPARDHKLTPRAAIKSAQLSFLKSKYADKIPVFIGDDNDDAIGAQHAGVHFIHACWGGACPKEFAHASAPTDLLDHVEELANG